MLHFSVIQLLHLAPSYFFERMVIIYENFDGHSCSSLIVNVHVLHDYENDTLKNLAEKSSEKSACHIFIHFLIKSGFDIYNIFVKNVVNICKSCYTY